MIPLEDSTTPVLALRPGPVITHGFVVAMAQILRRKFWLFIKTKGLFSGLNVQWMNVLISFAYFVRVCMDHKICYWNRRFLNWNRLSSEHEQLVQHPFTLSVKLHNHRAIKHFMSNVSISFLVPPPLSWVGLVSLPKNLFSTLKV